MSLSRLVNGNNYLTVNRDLAIILGLNSAVMLGEILDRYDFYKREGKLVNLYGQDGEWFFETIEDMQMRTALSTQEQRTAGNKLYALGLVSMVVKGVPGKRYFKVNEEAVENYINSNLLSRNAKSTTCFVEINNLEMQNQQCNKNNPKSNPKKNLKKTEDGGFPPDPLPASFVPKGGMGTAVEERSIAFQLTESIIPESDWEAIIKLYEANKKKIDSKRNPVGYLVDQWKRGKHKEFDLQETNKALSLIIYERMRSKISESGVRFTGNGNKLEISGGIGPTCEIYYSDCSFEEQLLHCLRKKGV